MTLVFYGFESGSDGAAVTTSNSGATLVSAPGGGSVTFDAAQRETGALGAKFTCAANNQSLVRTLAYSASSTMSFSFAFRTPASGTGFAAGLWLQSLRHSSGSALRFMLNPTTFMLYVVDATGANPFDLHQLAASTWYRVSGWVVVGGAGVNVSLNVYGAASDTPLNPSPVTRTGYNVGTASIVGGDSGIVSLPTAAVTVWADSIQWSDGVSEYLPYAASNTPPTVSAGPDQTVAVGATVNLASSASDADGSIESRQWSVTASPGAAPTITSSTSANASFVASTAGVYVLRMTVTDNDGASAYDETTVYVPAATVRPYAVTGSTQWTNVGGAASIPAALADESAATYAQSLDVGTSSVTVRLAPMTPGSRLDLDISGYLSEAGPGTATVDLLEGSTVRASWTVPVTTSDDLYALSTTPQQTQSIASWNALDVRVTWAAA